MTSLRVRAAASRGGVPFDGPFVRLLGPVQFVTADGVCIDLPSVPQRQVLAALALDPGVTVRSELLCERLRVSAGALRTTVSRLRGRIGAAVIVTDALGYRITCGTDAALFAALVLDHQRFPNRVEALRWALELPMGPALDEFRHESWSEAQVFRLDELHDLAVEDLADGLIELGQGGEVIATLEAHVATHPLRDRSRGLQIRALASVGRQADALRAYQAYRRHLGEETGTEPSAAVAEIERRVATGWNGRETTTPPSLTPLPPASLSPAAQRQQAPADIEVPLPAPLSMGADAQRIGRASELAVLEDELAAVIDRGGARGVLVAGEAGIGKTTLVGSFARTLHARGGVTILYGRCSDLTPDPLQPFRSVIGAIVDSAPTELLAEHARGCGGDLQRIAPRLANRTWVPAPTTADDLTERHQLFEAVADLLARTAALKPLIVVLEDLHWAEPTALYLMRHLVSGLGGARILLVATYRDGHVDPSDGLRAMLADLDRTGIRRVSLSGFDDEELGGLVRDIVGSTAPISTEVLAALRHQTAGNPLYATQLTRHLVDVGGIAADEQVVRSNGPLEGPRLPNSLADLVWSRVRALGPTSSTVLRSASVLGTSFDDDLLAQTSGRPAHEVAAALLGGVRAGLLVDAPDGGRRHQFVHGLVARALYTDLGPSERQRQHRLAADAIEAEADHVSLRVAVQLARHRSLAGEKAAAQRWASLAGDRAMAQLASDEGARWYQMAVDHARSLDRPDEEVAALLVKLGQAQLRAASLEVATVTLQEAVTLARRSGAHQTFVDAVLAGDRGLVRVSAADLDQLDLVEEALQVVDPADAPRRARLLAQHALELIHTPRDRDRMGSALSAIELSEQADDPTLPAQLVSAITYALWGLGTLALRADVARKAAASARRSADPVVQFFSSRASYFSAIESADPELGAASLARMRAIGARLGEPRLAWCLGVCDVFDATMAGRLDDAEELAGRNLELGLEAGEPDVWAIYGGQLFVIRSFAGRYGELLPALDDMVEANPGVLAFSLARAISHAVVGQRSAAQTLLDQGVACGFAAARDHYWLTTLVGHAVLALELEDVAAAGVLYDALVPFDRQVAFNGATSQGPISAYLGKLASVLGDHDAADAHLRSALAVTERWGWRYHEATTLVALARARCRASGAVDGVARAWLDGAATIADRGGFQVVIDQVAQLAD